MIRRLYDRWWQAGWSRQVVAISVVTILAATWLFIELADDAPKGEYLAVERQVLQWFRDDVTGEPIGPPWLPDAMRDITALGSGAVLVLLSLLILGYLCLRRRFPAAILLLTALGGGEALTEVLKGSFQRARPDVVEHLTVVTTLSFPSGHAMAASVFYLTCGALLAHAATRRREKIYILSAGILLAFLIGLSRVYLGVHYPSDVLAGWAAGTAWALLCWLASLWLTNRKRDVGAEDN